MTTGFFLRRNQIRISIATCSDATLQTRRNNCFTVYCSKARLFHCQSDLRRYGGEFADQQPYKGHLSRIHRKTGEVIHSIHTLGIIIDPLLALASMHNKLSIMVFLPSQNGLIIQENGLTGCRHQCRWWNKPQKGWRDASRKACLCQCP